VRASKNNTDLNQMWPTLNPSIPYIQQCIQTRTTSTFMLNFTLLLGCGNSAVTSACIIANKTKSLSKTC